MAEPNTDFDPNTRPDGAEHLPDQPEADGRHDALRDGAASRNAMSGPQPDDESLFVEFYRNAVDGEDHVRMRIPGDKLFQPDYLADDRYKARFPRQWAAYVAQEDQMVGQTPLRNMPWMDDGLRAHLATLGILSAEQLAGVQDSMLHNLGTGVRTMRDRAVQYLQKDVLVDQQNARIAELERQLGEVLAANAEQKPAPKPRAAPKR